VCAPRMGISSALPGLQAIKDLAVEVEQFDKGMHP